MSLYLANDTRYRHSYYGRRIGTRIDLSNGAISNNLERTNPNLAFKVTSLFDAKYLTNGYRYGHCYYWRRIGNRTQAFQWHQFQWHWVTSNPDFKVTILFNVKKTRKWYKIALYLQWPTNRKSHIVAVETKPRKWHFWPNSLFCINGFLTWQYVSHETAELFCST